MEPRVIPISSRSVSARARVWSLQSDAVLCRSAEHGNELAFSELHRRHYPALRAFVFHLLGSRHRHEDAEDVVQDAFARAFDSITERRFSGDFKRWLFAIARNRSIDLLRGERVRLVSLETSDAELGPQAAPEADSTTALAEAHDELAWLVAAMDELPERQRSALLLRELAGLSHEAIAEELGTTSGSARQLITRARDGIRDAAERDGREYAPKRSRSLRGDLLEAVPALPFAAAGLAASAGTTAGGSLAAGKVLATLLAALVLATAAGPAARGVADASESTGAGDSLSALAAPGAFGSANSGAAQRAGAGSQARSDFTAGELPKLGPGELPQPGAPGPSSDDHAHAAQPGASGSEATSNRPESREKQSVVVPKVTKPVKTIVELPGKAVEDLSGGLDGSKPPLDAVGDVVKDVTDTLGETTTDLLAPDSQ